MKIFSLMTTILILTISLVTAAAALETGDKAPSFDLKDQFGKQWKLDNLKGQVIVIVGADRDSGRAMGPWFDNLKQKYGNKIQLLGLLDLHTVPGIGRGIAKSRIKSETKDPMMIDFNGRTAKNYSINSKSPVAVVIDKDGKIGSMQNTTYNQEAFKKTTNAIDEALKEKI